MQRYPTRTEPILLSSLHRHVKNARTNDEYHKAGLADLVTRIREHGLLQPLVVSKNGIGYTLLAGHRRRTALKQLSAKDAPCLVLEKTDDQAALVVLLSENAQHHAFDPLKEAEAVAKLMESLSEDPHLYDRASTLLGKSVRWVRARLRLTSLGPSWRKAFADAEHPVSRFPVGHLELIAALAEFLNRIDDIIVFHGLDREGIRQIVELLIDIVASLVSERGIELRVTDRAKDRLATEGFDPVYGARPLKRLIQRTIQNGLARRILEGAVGQGDFVYRTIVSEATGLPEPSETT